MQTDNLKLDKFIFSYDSHYAIRKEWDKNKLVVFGISSILLSVLETTNEHINFDKESDEILRNLNEKPDKKRIFFEYGENDNKFVKVNIVNWFK